MKKFSAFLILLSLILSVASAEVTVEQNQYLDYAFMGLEEGNPFVQIYEEQTGAEITPILPCGVPYFFGGQDYRYLTMVKKVTQDSKYGAIGQKYIYGFDCTGFTRWIQEKASDKNHPGLSDMILKRSKYKEYRIEDLLFDVGTYKPSYMARDQLTVSTAPEIAQKLQIGDFLVAKHGGRHILMYIGTLRDYGYTEDTAGEAGAYLDYPLMINCGNDPNYKERTAQYIKDNDLDARPSNGGVTVSIVGMKGSDAPHLREDGVKEFYYFDLNGYQLSVYDVSDASSYVLWRTPEQDRGTGKPKYPECL